MPSKASVSWTKSSYWRLAAALLLSLLAHLFMLGGVNLHLPTLDETARDSPVQVQIVVPATQPGTRAVAVQTAKKPKPHPVSQPKPAPPVPETKPAEPVVPSNPGLPTADAVTDNAVPNPASDVTEPVDPASTDSDNDAAGLKSPSYVDMDFDLRRATDSDTVGIAHISYKATQDGVYTLSSVTEAKGLASLFIAGKLTQTSEGKVTSKGLQPESFVYQFGDRADKTQRASFDWQAGKLSMATSKRTDQVDLPEGTQDLLSFMYQFMFIPPLDQMQLTVTNGKKLRNYSYQFEGEETLQTGIGALRTNHIVKGGGDSEEKTELWLAIDYRNIPVKIRNTDKDGSVFEQIVTRLSTDITK